MNINEKKTFKSVMYVTHTEFSFHVQKCFSPIKSKICLCEQTLLLSEEKSKVKRSVLYSRSFILSASRCLARHKRNPIQKNIHAEKNLACPFKSFSLFSFSFYRHIQPKWRQQQFNTMFWIAHLTPDDPRS